MTASRWLPATPLAPDGAPPRVPSPALPETLTTAPVLGATREMDGVTLREVTFVAEAPGDVEVMLHLNGLTDNHRKNIEPALLQHIPSTDRHVLTYLLPEDGTWGYRYVRREHIPRGVGAERSGWLGVHADGRPDPLNPERLRHPHGEASSVVRMPDSPRRLEWQALESNEMNQPDPWQRFHLPAIPGAPETPRGLMCHYRPSGSDSAPLLILFDAEQLITMPLVAAMTRYRHPVDMLLLDSGTSEYRGYVLPNPERVAQHVQQALDIVSERDGRNRTGSDIIVSGVSYGGLAAASIVVHHPEIADRAIVQSGSFWFSPDHSGAPQRDAQDPGALTQCVITGPPRPGRTIILHVGTDEGTMATQTRLFADAAEEACIEVLVRQYRGGHDWAWWSHALFDGLDDLLG